MKVGETGGTMREKFSQDNSYKLDNESNVYSSVIH